MRVIFGGPEFPDVEGHDHPPRVRDRLGHVPARRAPRERFGSAQRNPPLRRASTRQMSMRRVRIIAVLVSVETACQVLGQIRIRMIVQEMLAGGLVDESLV